MGYIIKRTETVELAEKNYWLLLYGRRKVGKTFLLRELSQFPEYFTVKKDVNVLYKETTIPAQELLTRLRPLLQSSQTIVIDEFQRLNLSFLEELTQFHPRGKVILSGSSLRIVKKIFEPQSALLGFFTPLKIGFIRPSDILTGLSKELEPAQAIELATFLREPWLIPLYNKEKLLPFIFSVITQAKYTITALVGEIFTEEERELTKKYEVILSLIGQGIWNTKELTSLLYARKLIPDPSPTHLIQYLKNLEEMELVESIKLYKTKRKYYRLTSPIMNVYYYLDSRYDLGSRPLSFEEAKPTLQKLISLEIQNFIADVFAELYGGRKEYFISPEKEVDFMITARNRLEIVGEVKWKNIASDDLGKFRKNSEHFPGRRVMVGKDSSVTAQDMEIMLPAALIAQVQKRRKG